MPRVLNMHTDPIPRGAVSIMRPGPFGNPFRLTGEHERTSILLKHREWTVSQPAFVARIKRELTGRDLVCCCAPRPCHGDLYLCIANDLPLPPLLQPIQPDLFAP